MELEIPDLAQAVVEDRILEDHGSTRKGVDQGGEPYELEEVMPLTEIPQCCSPEIPHFVAWSG
jgi:hypothetical protein